MRPVALLVAVTAALAGCASAPAEPHALAMMPSLDFEASTDDAASFFLFLDHPTDVTLTLRLKDAAGAFVHVDGPGSCDREMDSAAASHLAEPTAVEEPMACGVLAAGAHQVDVAVDFGRIAGTLSTSAGQLVHA